MLKQWQNLDLKEGKIGRKHHTTEEYRQRERYKLDDNKEILNDLENLKQSDVFSFKAKTALFAKLENLILNQDRNYQKNKLKVLKAKFRTLRRNFHLHFEQHQLQNQISFPKHKFSISLKVFL